MRRTAVNFAVVLLLSSPSASSIAAAQEASDRPAQESKQPKPAARDGAEAPAERAVVTAHSLQLAGHAVAYKATAGTLLIHDDKDKPDASVFYVAYTVDAEPAKRPVTFLYNGGPGSSSIWLHMGSFGPVRVVTSSPEATAPAPYQLVPNVDCLLDKTDLVFVDAIGTGYSRRLAKDKADKDKAEDPNKRFWGIDPDIDAFGRFVARYVTVNQRWNSPKFLFGESYGTTRSAGLARYLEEHGVAVNGVVLLSSILNYASRLPGLDDDYVNLLPSYAAMAWYHDKLANKPAALEPFLTEVRTFARGDYAVALSKGQDLPPAERDAIAERLSRYTGLSATYLKEANLRVSQRRFRKELLRDERRTVGRYDGRYEGIDLDAAGENAGERPGRHRHPRRLHGSVQRLPRARAELHERPAVQGVRRRDLRLGLQARPARSEAAGAGADHGAGDLSEAMRTNPHLKVLSANGYFDLATPFFATEYDLAHLEIDPKLRGNLTVTYYPSGHMVYLNLEAARQFKQDLAKFYDDATQR